MPKKKTEPPKTKPKKYRLTLDERQIGIVQEALDLYYRTGMGQTREFVEQLIPSTLPTDEWCDRRDLVEELIRGVRAAAMPELGHPNAAYSISSREIGEHNRIACDIYKVIRSHLAWEREPNGGMFVCFDPVYAQSEVPLPTVETIKEE